MSEPPQIHWAPPTPEQLGPDAGSHTGWTPPPPPSAPPPGDGGRRDLAKLGAVALAGLLAVGLIVFALVAGLSDDSGPSALADTSQTADLPTPEPPQQTLHVPVPGPLPTGPLPTDPLPTDPFPTDPGSLTRCASNSPLITAVTYVSSAAIITSLAQECVWHGTVSTDDTRRVGDLDLLATGGFPTSLDPPYVFTAQGGTRVTVGVEQQSDGLYYVTSVRIS